MVDKSPFNGLNLYRLKQDGIYSGVSYSQVVSVQYAEGNSISSNVSIYPNPGINLVNLTIKPLNNEPTSYNIKFVNSLGIIVKEVTSSQPFWYGSIEKLQPGIYIVKVLDDKTQSVIGQSKFVKQ
jgi:hypothetical protein